MKWRWLERTDHDRPWQGLQFSIPAEAEQLFLAATECILGDGQKLRFWYDRWLDGQSIEQLAPNLLPFVRAADRSLTVAAALDNYRWVRAFRGALSVPALVEFVELWERIDGLELGDDEDIFRWRLEANGRFSARSAYAAFFLGRSFAPCATELWSAGAPLKHKLHLWFALKDRLWTADRLGRRGLERPAHCPLCCQEEIGRAHV